MNLESSTLPTCYRHPDRETRLSCSRCGRPVCVDCMRTAAVGQQCQECAAPAPGSRTLDMSDVRKGRARAARISYAVLGVCVAIFVVQLLVPPVGAVVYGLAIQDNALVSEGQFWRLATAAFLHDPSGFTHILFNMWALYVFGPQLEREVGSLPFLGLYLASAIAGGAVFSVAVPQGQAVGASGAIFGLFGAWLAAAYRGRHTTAGLASFRQLLVLLGINLALPLIVPGIAWQAHVGGLVAGFAIATVWTLPALQRREALRTAAAAAVATVALLAVVLR